MRLRLLLLSAFFSITLFGISVKAETSGELSGKIADTNSQIQQLEAEIATYSTALTQTQKAGNTLANAIKTLDLTKKKLDTQAKLTNEQITSVTLQIRSLGAEIGVKEASIAAHVSEISDTLKKISAGGDKSPVEIMLSQNTLSGALDEIYSVERLQEKVRQEVEQLKSDRLVLSVNKSARESDKTKLVKLQGQLLDQQKLVEQNRQAKTTLLAQTKNTEANYKKLLDQKIAQKAQFEADLHSYEAKLKATIDFDALPHPGSGVLAWPLDSVFITQYFGDTDFAKQNAAVYNGHGHNGVDLRASIGTPVKAAASGTVTATGNTDIGCPGGSYGNWVLVDHGTGLSTLYAHLSLIKVAQGESVSLGELIGYSGSTGYATGPHLHFTVYATAGVKVAQLYHGTVPSKCPPMPVASINAYLNPLLYL